ncbi:MAG: tetratricopeptide repeat protein [Methylophilus sp.]|uniref:tetratricopeptide repeat protein n=1 Tax=Methylophilus sp. TaxID=29541 RepID=UPI003FA16581
MMGNPDAEKNEDAALYKWLAEADHLLRQNNPDAALTLYTRVLAQEPEHFDALVGCGRALKALKQYAFALAHFDYAVALQPGSMVGYHYRALVYHDTKRFDEAILDHQQALSLDPNSVFTTLNLANTLAEQDKFEQALGFYNHVIALSPGYAMAYNNRGNLYLDRGLIQQALQDYASAAALEPESPQFRWNQSLMHILLGEYAQGWPLFEAGMGIAGFARGLRKPSSKPEWLGQSEISGKRVLLYAEQGLGDTIQFCRYASLVAALGAQVILEVQPALVNLLQTLQPQHGGLPFEIVAQGDDFTDYDLHTPLMSLPMIFNTTVDSIPAETPYLYANQPQISSSMAAHAKRPRIGLVWSGSNTHHNDHRRSLALAQLMPLLQLPYEFHCLQKEIRPADAAELANVPGLTVHQQNIGDFTDTAALINAMDIIISVDTSVAHLAGAMGKPVWILLPFVPDYRWMLHRHDTPWYPQARLFRQADVGDWQAVVQDVCTSLQAIFPATSAF